MESESNNKRGKVVLLIFLLICSGLGIAAFTMSLTKKCDEGFEKPTYCGPDNPVVKWNICTPRPGQQGRNNPCINVSGKSQCKYQPPSRCTGSSWENGCSCDTNSQCGSVNCNKNMNGGTCDVGPNM